MEGRVEGLRRCRTICREMARRITPRERPLEHRKGKWLGAVNGVRFLGKQVQQVEFLKVNVQEHMTGFLTRRSSYQIRNALPCSRSQKFALQFATAMVEWWWTMQWRLLTLSLLSV